MKKQHYLFATMAFAVAAIHQGKAQTNTFPANGNVGIGTLAPAEKLSVVTALGVNGITHSDGVIKLSTFLNAGAGYLGTVSNHPLCFRTNSSNAQMILMQTGNLGIGTTSPTERLTVRSASGVAGFAHTDGVVRIGSMLNASGAHFGTLSNHPLFLRTNNGAAQVTLLQNGRLGIGTTTPLGMLDVHGGDAYVQGVRIGVGNLAHSSNTCVGVNALSTTTTNPVDYPYDISGGDNTAIGYFTLNENYQGWRNTAVGSRALANCDISSNNCGIGYKALGEMQSADNNTAVGAFALASITTSGGNTAVGASSLYSSASGGGHTAVGYNSLYYANNSFYNTAVGTNALYLNTTGSSNTAIGYRSLDSNSAGQGNTASGSDAMLRNKTGSYNTATGSNALLNSTTGSFNTAMGRYALNYTISGSSNTAIGYFASPSTSALSNTTSLGYNARPTASNQARIGNSVVTSIGGYANWTNVSDGRVKRNIKNNVPGLDFINLLLPVTYTLHLDAADKIINTAMPETENDKMQQQQDATARAQKQAITYTGFIAQDVEKAAQKINYDFSGVDAPKNKNDLYGIRYAEFVVPLVKAVQELATQNEAIKKELEALKEMMKNEKAGNTQQVLLSEASLSQNVPNPYQDNTSISYTLPQKFRSAQINITGKNGNILKTIPVSGSGKNTISVNTQQLSAGTYQYSLLVDDKVIDTKQMLLIR